MSIGIAKPTPSAVPVVLWICALMPITRPSPSKSGPPEFPRLMGASVWIAFATVNPDVSESIERPVAETTPTERDVCFPNGLPIAATGSPTTTPRGAAERERREHMVGRLHPDHADVAEEVPADDLRRDALAVGELDVDRARGADRCRRAGLELGDVRDDVRVREDRTGPVDHEAGALRRAVRAEVRVDGDDAVRAGRIERGRIERRRRPASTGRGSWASPAPGRPPRPWWSSPRDPRPTRRGSPRLPRPRRRVQRRRLRWTPASSHRSSGPSDRPRPVSTWKPVARTHFHVETASSADRDGGGRERERERRPPRRAAQLDRALHVGRELARDRETEPAARCLGAVDPVEAIEDALCVLGRDPGTVVVDGEDDPAAGSRRRDDDLGAPTGCGRARSRSAHGRSGARAPRRRPPRPRRRPRPSPGDRSPPRAARARRRAAVPCPRATPPRAPPAVGPRPCARGRAGRPRAS